MKPIDYSNIPLDEIVRRLRLKRGDDVVPRHQERDAIVTYLVELATTLPLYKTSLTDPIDAVVELLDKVIPSSSLDELQLRARDGDDDAMMDLSLCHRYGWHGMAVDMKKSADYSRSAICADNARAVAYSMNSALGDDDGNERFIPMNEGVNSEIIDDKMLWGHESMLCAADYVCVVSMLMAQWAVMCKFCIIQG